MKGDVSPRWQYTQVGSSHFTIFCKPETRSILRTHLFSYTEERMLTQDPLRSIPQDRIRIHAGYLIRGNTWKKNGQEPEELETMEPWCRSDLKWRKEGCLVEDVCGPKGVPQDHWGVLELKSSFKGAPYFPTAVLHYHWCQAQLLARSPRGSKASAWRWTQWQISGHSSLTVDFHLMLLQSEVWVGAFAWMVHKPNLLPELPLALGYLLK